MRTSLIYLFYNKTMTEKQILFNVLQGEKNSIPYRPEIAKKIWVVSAIILQQMIYRRKWKKFYKFTEPAQHELYKEGDSWTEELWMNVKQFTNSLKKIAYKLWKTKNQIKKEDALIIYFTDSNRLTWYELNLDNIYKLLNSCYNVDFLVSDKTADTKINDKTADTNNTENNTENTHENINAHASSFSEKDQSLKYKTELENFLAWWNAEFSTKYNLTETIFRQWVALRQKYSKKIIEAWILKYIDIKKKRDWKDYAKIYITTPLAFLKKETWLQSYL